MSEEAGVVVVGAGQAAFQLAVSLREEGYEGRVRVIGDEPHPCYARPPLSKAFLHTDEPAAALHFRPASFYDAHGIELMTGLWIVAIDRAHSTALDGSGRRFGYDHLVLATGARNRVLDLPGAKLGGVRDVRTADDAARLRGDLRTARQLVVIGGGFLGLEVASVARGLGVEVTVVEAMMQPMGRAVSREVSQAAIAHHERRGIRFHLGCPVARVHGDGGSARSVELGDGTVLPADLLLVAAGVVPNDELASAAGLEVDRGVLVDEGAATADPRIHAIGDCAAIRQPVGVLRFESVQGAIDQARRLARRLVGKPPRAVELPWFWSDQSGWKLQIAGWAGGCTEELSQPPGPAFSVYRFRDGFLQAVESVNRPVDHIHARRVLASGRRITRDQVIAAKLDAKVLASQPVPIAR